ncbi:MAG: lysylphosphatidylglycerol synthase transmembrane domain-containing protein, partial [Candidatus Krumholzibacteria bacterium]|nr:lysylphosphatidylglycerol synthase transmembrane domain-containing protein [Candidatus Krumholzibacteria bacterium]
MRHKWLFQLIGVLMFVYILNKVDVRNVVSLLFGARYAVLAIALALTVGFVVLKAVRWKYLLAMQGIDYETRDCFLAYLASMYVGLVTPGRLGDFVKAIYLRTDKGVTLGRGFSSVFADRLFDLLILIAMAFSGALALALTRNMLIIILCWILLFLATVFIFLNERCGKPMVRLLFRVLMPKRLGSGLEGQFEDFYCGIAQLKKAAIFVPLLLS